MDITNKIRTVQLIFIDPSVCLKCCSKFVLVLSHRFLTKLSLLNTSIICILYSETKRLNDLPVVTQLVSGGATFKHKLQTSSH